MEQKFKVGDIVTIAPRGEYAYTYAAMGNRKAKISKYLDYDRTPNCWKMLVHYVGTPSDATLILLESETKEWLEDTSWCNALLSNFKTDALIDRWCPDEIPRITNTFDLLLLFFTNKLPEGSICKIDSPNQYSFTGRLKEVSFNDETDVEFYFDNIVPKSLGKTVVVFIPIELYKSIQRHLTNDWSIVLSKETYASPICDIPSKSSTDKIQLLEPIPFLTNLNTE